MSTLPMLVTPAQTQAQLDSSPSAKVLDATWYMPNDPRDAARDFEHRRLPGAQRWDLDDIAAPHALGLKHMLPSAEAFARACGERGIASPDTPVVLYDQLGLFSAPRALFTFATFGHRAVHVLDGGLPRWLGEGRPVEDGPPQQPSETASYAVEEDHSAANIRSYEDMQRATTVGDDLILDASSGHRSFHGTAPEPRPGLSSGHMPRSLSLPFSALLTPPSATHPPYQQMLPPDALRRMLADAVGGVDELDQVLAGQRAVVATCGSGMSAAIIWLAMQVLGAPNVAIYDESWTGYAMREQSVIETSA